MTGSQPTRVLFLCTGNSARSQMAEAWLRALGEGRFEAHSAGTDPHGLNPFTVRAMAEAGIDVAGAESKHLDRYIDEPWDYVVTVCDRAAESCPLFPGGGTRLHWSFPDPAAVDGDTDRLEAFRAVRDDIRSAIERFVAGVDVGAGGSDGR